MITPLLVDDELRIRKVTEHEIKISVNRFIEGRLTSVSDQYEFTNEAFLDESVIIYNLISRLIGELDRIELEGIKTHG